VIHRGKPFVAVEWFDLEPNFDGKAFIQHRYDGIVIDSWADGINYWFLVEDEKGKLHRISHDKLRIVDNQTHINRRNATT
jgi:hypothetical protein